jgi:hypothetical protein
VEHAQLVRIARNWLAGSQRCRVIVCEHQGGCNEEPDAIAWRTQPNTCRTESILVECKASRADFFADQKKWHRIYRDGLGDLRWYLTPRGLLDVGEVPDGWGLIEARSVLGSKTNYHCRKMVHAPERERTIQRLDDERTFLSYVTRNALQAVGLVSHFGVVIDDDGDA